MLETLAPGNEVTITSYQQLPDSRNEVHVMSVRTGKPLMTVLKGNKAHYMQE